MQFYRMYDQANLREVDKLIGEVPHCQLITVTPEGRPRVGLFNHARDGRAIVLHLNRRDEQLVDLRASPRALVTFQDTLAVIPSYWVEEENASAATMYYRYAEFDCDAEILESYEAMLPCFQRLMDHHQPEGGYSRLDPGLEMYRSAFDMLAIVVLRPRATRTKWKLGQNRPAEIRQRVIAKLRERAQGSDLRAADEVERLL